LAEPDAEVAAHLARTRAGHHWLFVGRLAPNKCQHDLIAAFAAYRLAYDSGARLTLIGSEAAPSYSDALYGLIDDLGLHGAVTVAGSVTDAELAAYYDDADVFVCLSRHEGFCVPLLEAMRHDVPVVAFAAAAVPDTVGDAAVLLQDPSPVPVAAAVRELLEDSRFGKELVEAGRRVVAEHALAPSAATWLELLRSHLAGVGG
jgi:glycosyltransferase involved in cell wall biosynthesis